MAETKPFSYAAAYETVRTVGRLLAPDELEWATELDDNSPHSQYLLHLSCMAHYTPHIPYLAQQILRKIGLDCAIVGGPEFCCGALHVHFGDEDLGKQTESITLFGFRKPRPEKVFSICPDCDEIFEKMAARQPYRHANVSELFIAHLDALKAAVRPVERRVVIHYHDVNAARQRDAARMREILSIVPGLELIPAEHSTGPGVHCQTLHPMPEPDQKRMFDEARALNADAVVVPYHSCFRQHCKMELSHGVRVEHYFGILARALGIGYREPFRELRLLDDLDAAVERLRPRIERLGFDPAVVRVCLQRTVYR